MKELQSLLEDVSDIATRESLNIDYLPAVVTVINAETFRSAGIQNLSEALDMLPGIQIQLSPMGYTMTTVRGFKNPNAYLSDKIKILIDGVAINNEVSGSSFFYMDFPLQLVDKIEVLRGPGSTMYGAGSFYATINVITRSGNEQYGDRLMLGTGSYDYYTANGNSHLKAGDWELFGDAYYQQRKKAISSYQDDPWDNENRYGVTDDALHDFSAGLKAKNGGFEWLTRLKRNRAGNHYSFEQQFDPIPEKETSHTTTYLFSQLSYKTTLDDIDIEAKAGYSYREFLADANIYSIASAAAKFAVVGVNMQEGFVYRENSREENYEAEVSATLPERYGNKILTGVGTRQANVTKDAFYNSVDNAIIQNMAAILAHPDYDSFRYREENEPAFWHNPTYRLLQDGVDRTIYYGYVQDLVNLTPKVDAVLGLRVDDYSDFGTKLSKRAALVYRATDKAIFKLLYGSAFRAPTLIEAYQNGHINFRAGNPAIKPEETNTYEAVAIYSPDYNNKLILNLFYSELDNVIDLEENPYTDPGYQNYDERSSWGVELEYFLKMQIRHNLYFNATYLDTEYTIPPEPVSPTIIEQPITVNMPDISKLMLKAMYIYQPAPKLSFGTTWRYFSKTTSTRLLWVVTDPAMDPTVDAVHIFDQTISYKPTPASTINVTVKNLFDADVKDPSYYYLSNGGVYRDGRNFFLSFETRF